MKTVLIHNPTAGSAEHSKKELLAALKMAGLAASYYSIKEDKPNEVLRKKPDLVFVAGGDGTIAKVIARLKDRSVPIGILPIGTANNIARSMGVNGTVIELVENLRSESTRRLDIGWAEGPWGRRKFVEAVGIGPLGHSFEKARSNLTGAGNLRNGRHVLQKLIRKGSVLELEVTVDGTKLPSDILALEIMNTPYTGPALPLAPMADPGDGKFDIVWLPVSRRGDMISWLEAPNGSWPPFETRQGRKVTIEGKLPHQRVDDQVFKPVKDKQTVLVDLEHEAAKILTPMSLRESEANGRPGNGKSKKKKKE
jgi:diacylglycerol kinase (ATP)